MKRLLFFLNNYKNVVVFLILEIISLSLVFNKNFHEKIKNINSSNLIIANIYSFFSSFKMYPHLNDNYKQVLIENAKLKEQLLLKSRKTNAYIHKTFTAQFEIIPAQVINNSIIHNKNYLTINKGNNYGIVPGMGVVTEKGVVGKVKYTSKHFSTIVSLLHTDVLTSAKLVSSGVMGTIRWDGYNPLKVELLYIPRHLEVKLGDKVVTTGYNSIFYEGIPIGEVSQVNLDKESLFNEILVDVSNDFSTLQDVYVIKNKLAYEKDSLENITKAYYE